MRCINFSCTLWRTNKPFRERNCQARYADIQGLPGDLLPGNEKTKFKDARITKRHSLRAYITAASQGVTRA